MKSFTSLGVCASFLLVSLTTAVQAFENNCNKNLAVYWGQNSYGAANPNSSKDWQKPLRFYCEDDSLDMIPLAFLTTFFAAGGDPSINLANTCNSEHDSPFPGTELANCTSVMQDDIKYCQSRGKAVTLSLGGATGGVGFQSDSQATTFADNLWNLFLGGSSDTRPFGNAVLDGVDLDIEGGGSAHYQAFLGQLKSHFDSTDKKYYVTAAPQCVYPDANLQATMNAYPFDAVFVQFYNNPCGLQAYGQASQWNFGMWDYWARHISPNPDVKVYIGAPASNSAAGGGYVPLSDLQTIAVETRQSFPSFGGIMFWDESQAYNNGRMDQGIKKTLTNGGTCNASFKFPACDAPAFKSGQSYSAGSRVSSNGYIWEAKWYASQEPTADANGEWSPVSACSESVSSPASSSAAPSSSSVDNQPSTSAAGPTTEASSGLPSLSSAALPPQSSSTGDDACGSSAAWSGSTAYSGGKQVVYSGQVWKAKWWTYGETPGGHSGVWVAQGSCVMENSKSASFEEHIAHPEASMTADPARDNDQGSVAVQTPESKNMQTSAVASEGVSLSAAEPTGSVSQNHMPTPLMSSSLSLADLSTSVLSDVPEASASMTTDKATGPSSCTGVLPLWRPNDHYESGSKVVYRHTVYVAQRENQNEDPSNTTGTWSVDDECTKRFDLRSRLQSMAFSRACKKIWSPESRYQSRDIVSHDGYLFRAQADSAGETPTAALRSWKRIGRCETDKKTVESPVMLKS